MPTHVTASPSIRARRAPLFCLAVSLLALSIAVSIPAARGADRAPAASPAQPTAAGASQAPSNTMDEALFALRAASRAANSDVLIVWRDGELLAEDYSDYRPDRRYETMSATKGIVALAIGLLLQEGKIASLDQPVADFFPEWRQGRKAAITIRHLMTHTSGLQNARTTDVEIYPSPDFVQLALSAELSDDPGTHWAYNNKATNLLPGLVERASGMPIDAYMRSRLFKRIGVRDVEWVKDAAGHPHGMAGFQVTGRDLLKIGTFLLDRGRVGKDQLIAPDFLDELAKPDPAGLFAYSGHLWWPIARYTDVIVDDALLQRMRARGVDAAFVDALATIRGEYPEEDGVQSPEEDRFVQALTRALGPDYQQRLNAALAGKVTFPKMRLREVIGMGARGSFGQELAVFPAQRVVVVRLVYNGRPGFDERRDSFMTLRDLATDFARAAGDAPHRELAGR